MHFLMFDIQHKTLEIRIRGRECHKVKICDTKFQIIAKKQTAKHFMEDYRLLKKMKFHCRSVCVTILPQNGSSDTCGHSDLIATLSAKINETLVYEIRESVAVRRRFAYI